MNSKPVLLQSTIWNIEEYENNRFDFSFMPLQKVFDDVDSDSSVSRISGSVYDSKIISICGINASGKTSLLSLLYFILSVFFCNRDANDFTTLLNRFHKQVVDMEFNILYKADNHIYKLISTLSKKDGKYFFSEESLLILNDSGPLSKSLINRSSSFIRYAERSSLPEDSKIFLEKGKSISAMTLIKSQTEVKLYDKGVNPFVEDFERIPVEVIKYLDSSIESITRLNEKDFFLLKRKNSEPKEISYIGLLNHLSSGTRRGIGFFSDMFRILKTGGYFIIDELEDNLNKTIVMNIIEFFMRKSTNPFNAHLVFTTHYQEIVDILPRNDSVYIAARNNDMLTIKNLAAFLKRKDTRRSELLFSDYYDLGTAIDYSAYNALRKGIENLAKKEMEETR